MNRALTTAFCFLCCGAPAVLALPTVKLVDRPGTTGGGEFGALTSQHGDFVTFCLESGETVQLGKTYYYTISNSTSTGDPLSLPAAWLYLQFTAGTLGNYGPMYSYTSSNADANDLQRAIWFLEGESGGVNNYYAQLAVSQSGPASVDNAGTYPVAVMVLWQNLDGTGPAQDQLIRVPDGGSVLPAAGMGFVALLFIRRMRRSG